MDISSTTGGIVAKPEVLRALFLEKGFQEMGAYLNDFTFAVKRLQSCDCH